MSDSKHHPDCRKPWCGSINKYCIDCVHYQQEVARASRTQQRSIIKHSDGVIEIIEPELQNEFIRPEKPIETRQTF